MTFSPDTRATIELWWSRACRASGNSATVLCVMASQPPLGWTDGDMVICTNATIIAEQAEIDRSQVTKAIRLLQKCGIVEVLPEKFGTDLTYRLHRTSPHRPSDFLRRN